MKKKFKLIKFKNGYIIKKRYFFIFYNIFTGFVFNSTNACITYIHTIYYPDECEINVVE